MKRDAIRSAVLHAKYGSGLLLLLFDSVMLALLLIDIINVGSLDLSYLSLIRPSDTLGRLDWASLRNFFVLLVLPVVLTLLGNFAVFKYAPERYFKYTTASGFKDWCLLVHVAVVALCVIHTNSVELLQEASGMCGPLLRGSYCFISKFTFLEDFQFYLMGAIVLPVMNLVLKDVLYKGRELTREFDFWRLVGAVGDYQPAYGDEIIYVNSASMAPSIKAVNARTTAYHSEYQRKVPTSDSARKFLFETAEYARKELYKYLFGDDGKRKKIFDIEFFTGTSRALEAGLLRIGDITHVILSQYEHPSQVDVVKWVCETQRTMTYKSIMPHSPSFFQGAWATQKAEVCKSIEEDLACRSEGRVAIVLSEVHYMTGIHIRVDEIIEELRRRHQNLVFIVDGSQAVGNLVNPLADFADQLMQDDFYYFSAHKWLLSPNTCGVLVSYIKNYQGMQPYDVFGVVLPTSTIDPNTVFGLASALEFLFGGSRLFDRLSALSRDSKEYFRKLVREVDSRIEIVEAATGDLNSSLFLAVKPSLGYRWKFDSRTFWGHMRERGVDLTVIPETNPYFNSESSGDLTAVDAYLLRISFPYFLIGKNVKNLLAHLSALIREAN